MRAVDTSVIVPALLQWHDAHEDCRYLLEGAMVPSQALLESYSVLTRMPGGVDSRLASEVVLERLAPLEMAQTSSMGETIRRLVGAGVSGGAVYDGLIGLTAAAGGCRLLTRDRRAARTYEALGVDYELLV
ncbi:MAG: PIN domain-containing protein [Acidimicrobiia bacterium]